MQTNGNLKDEFAHYDIESLKEMRSNRELMLKSHSVNEDKKHKLLKELNAIDELLLIRLEEKNKKIGRSYKEWEQYLQVLPPKETIHTGLPFIDNAFDGGFETGNFINLVGESGAGKTTLGIHILANISKERQVVFFSLEMGIRRSIAKISRFIETEEQKNNLIIDFDSREIEVILKQIKIYTDDGIKFFFIDSKMKLDSNRYSKEYDKIAYISGQLSKITQELDVTIMLINQIGEEDARSGRVSLKGNNDQRFDSDIILVYKKDDKDNNTRLFQVFKNRQNEREFTTRVRKLDDGRLVEIAGSEVENCVITEFKV
jgi:KaiC/GvpD/RAD55 family RecA-like ATPase